MIRRVSRGLDYVILILSLLALFIGAYAFWDTHQVMTIASSDQYTVYKPNKEDNLSLDELKNINEDVIGWIDVYGTKIDYPIVQGEDNWEYLNKTVLGDFSTAGSIFLDARNNQDFSDFQNILYGHYMAERKMFGDVERFKSKEFFDTHQYGAIHRTGQKSLGIEFFAYLKTVGTDQTILSTAKSSEDKQGLIEHIYEGATYSRPIDFKEEDRLVVLDTCDLTITNGRYILIGRLTDQVVGNPYPETKSNHQLSSLIKRAYRMNVLFVLIVLWLVLVTIYFIYDKIQRKKKGEEANPIVQK